MIVYKSRKKSVTGSETQVCGYGFVYVRTHRR